MYIIFLVTNAHSILQDFLARTVSFALAHFPTFDEKLKQCFLFQWLNYLNKSLQP